MYRISVIIPFYNDESHLHRCLESVCRQTIADKVQIVLVDDGSTDSSVKIAEEKLHEFRRDGHDKIVRHSINQGVAKARHTGLNAADGDFILFCDSDDYMDLNMCECMLDMADSAGCDVVICDYKSIKGKEVYNITDCYKEDFLKELILCNCTGSLCNKLIKNDLLKRDDFVYPEKDFSEDYVYSLQAAIHAKKIGYVPFPLYNYDHREGSVVSSSSESRQRKRNIEDIDNLKLDLKILEDNGLSEKFHDEIIFHKLKVKNTYRNNLEIWRSTLPELDSEIFKCKYISFRSRVAYLLTKMGIYSFLRRVIR